MMYAVQRHTFVIYEMPTAIPPRGHPIEPQIQRLKVRRARDDRPTRSLCRLVFIRTLVFSAKVDEMLAIRRQVTTIRIKGATKPLTDLKHIRPKIPADDSRLLGRATSEDNRRIRFAGKDGMYASRNHIRPISIIAFHSERPILKAGARGAARGR